MNATLINRGPVGIIARRFLHRNNHGKRVPGWEEVNFKKLALAMGRFTAEDAVKIMQNSRCNPELVSVQI